MSVCVSICPLSSAEAPSVEKRWEKRERERARKLKNRRFYFPSPQLPRTLFPFPDGRPMAHSPTPRNLCGGESCLSVIICEPARKSRLHRQATPSKPQTSEPSKNCLFVCMPVSLSFCPIKRLRRQAKRNKPAYRPRCLLFPSFGLNTTRLVHTIPWDQIQTSPFYQATS